MPELPEVTTTVNGLQKVLPGLVISHVWTDLAIKNQKIKQFQKTIKNKKFFDQFKKEILRTKILKVERKAKNILIHIAPTSSSKDRYTILIHLKMTGHLLWGKYKKVVSSKQKSESWKPIEDGPLHDPYNRFIHVVFSFKNSKNNLVFCDARKFGKITIFPTDKIKDEISGLHKLGPEPLEDNFTFKKFIERLNLKPKGNIKTVLMNQEIISGIGNIYSDEMLWLAEIHPESKTIKIPAEKLKLLYQSMKKVLMEGIKFGGDSTSDYRNIDGKRGNFQGQHNVYQRKNEACEKKGCKGVIIRKVINGRSAHFCDTHQKLF